MIGDMMDVNTRLLSSLSCVVKGKFSNIEQESSCCGTVIDIAHGYVIAHGSILAECVTANKKLLSKIKKGKMIKDADLPRAKLSLLMNKHIHDMARPQINMCLTVDNAVNSHEDYRPVSCQLLSAFRNKNLHNSLLELMSKSSWKFADNSLDNDTDNDKKNNNSGNDNQNQNQNLVDNDVSYELLSYFLLLKFNPSDAPVVPHFHPKYTKVNRVTPQIGDVAEIVATPFAALCPSVFFNGYSRGVISNVSGTTSCWIVTDARCIPGCEGGPLFIKKKLTDETSQLAGVIVSSLCWKNNEWIGFSVACGIDSLLDLVTSCHNKIIPKVKVLEETSPSEFKLNVHIPVSSPTMAERSTVLVQCGLSWGTGVIVDRQRGIVLTCSHVLQDADSRIVTVTPSESKTKHAGEVIYRQDPVVGPYDLAVIRCLDAVKHLPWDWTIQISPAIVGSDVFVSGHAVFSAHHRLKPSLCRGVVSKVIRRFDKPVMVQTTCAVHAGVSGGPLLSSDGQLLGIAVCNTRDASSNTSYPHLNLCIPITSVWPYIQRYLDTGDKDVLSSIQVQDSDLKELWALGTKNSCDSVSGHHKSKL